MDKILSFFPATFAKVLKPYQAFTSYLFQETDATALGVFRLLFGKEFLVLC